MIIPSNLLTPDEEIAMLEAMLDATSTLNERLMAAANTRNLTQIEIEYFSARVAMGNRWSALYEAREAARQQAAAPPALPAPDDYHALPGAQAGEL